MKPRVGMLVNYVVGKGELRPLVVTRVINEHTINGTIFSDGPADSRFFANELTTFKGNIAFSETLEPNTWHFAELEGKYATAGRT